MPPLSDDAFAVRGGMNGPDNFSKGSDVLTDAAGVLSGLSVQCALGKTVYELSQGLSNGQIGVATLEEIRIAGGEVDPDPQPGNPDHCLLRGLDAVTASRLFRPTIPNPHRVR